MRNRIHPTIASVRERTAGGQRRRLLTASTAFGLVATAALLGISSPANATGGSLPHGGAVKASCTTHPGVEGEQPLCLYYLHNATGGEWAVDGAAWTLNPSNSGGGQEFYAGTGAGEGQWVWNNATAVGSDNQAGGGTVWYNSYDTGNWDYITDGYWGELNRTYNQDASLMIGHP